MLQRYLIRQVSSSIIGVSVVNLLKDFSGMVSLQSWGNESQMLRSDLPPTAPFLLPFSRSIRSVEISPSVSFISDVL